MAFDVVRYKGKLLVNFGSMKGGKTDETIKIARTIEKHSKFKVAVITNDVNTRDGEELVSESGARYPAEVAEAKRPESILDIVYKRDQEKGTQDVVIISEANFYAPKIVAVVNRLKEQGRAVIVEGLDLTFRGEPFGPMGVLKAIADESEPFYPFCQIVNNGSHCSNTARNTVRLIRLDDEDDSYRVDFKRGDEFVRGKYRYAPYFDPTVVVEDKSEREPRVVYTAACGACFKTPGKPETKKVYCSIRESEGISREEIVKRHANIASLERIIRFLEEERHVVECEGRLKAVPHFYEFESITYVS